MTKLVSKLFMALSLLLVLSGCFETVREVQVPVERTVYVRTAVPAVFTDRVAIPAPPNRKQFVEADDDTQKELLAEHNKRLIKTIKELNDERKKLGTWDTEQAKKLQSQNTEPKKQ